MCLYGPSGCVENLLSIRSAGLQALFYFCRWSFLFLDHKECKKSNRESRRRAGTSLERLIVSVMCEAQSKSVKDEV